MFMYRSSVGVNCPSRSVILAATRRCCAQVADIACGSTSDDEGMTEASINEAQGARPAAVEAWIEYKRAAQSMKEVGGESLGQSSYARCTLSSPVYAVEVQARTYQKVLDKTSSRVQDADETLLSLHVHTRLADLATKRPNNDAIVPDRASRITEV